MSDTDELLEFGSQAWLAEAERYLRQAVAARGEALAGVRYCINETVTDPPPHLSPDGSPLSWWFAFADGDIAVGTGERDDADYRDTGDYATVLPLARTVYRDHPEAMAAAVRGEGAGVDVPAALGPVLLGLHDHLARRTR